MRARIASVGPTHLTLKVGLRYVVNNETAQKKENVCLPKRIFWKTEQKMKCGFSRNFSMVRRPNRLLTALKRTSKTRIASFVALCKTKGPPPEPDGISCGFHSYAWKCKKEAPYCNDKGKCVTTRTDKGNNYHLYNYKS